jgi:hypothetical protein
LLPLFLTQVKKMEAAAAKDLKDSKASSTATFNSLAKRLEEKYKQLDQLNKKYQQVGSKGAACPAAAGRVVIVYSCHGLIRVGRTS